MKDWDIILQLRHHHHVFIHVDKTAFDKLFEHLKEKLDAHKSFLFLKYDENSGPKDLSYNVKLFIENDVQKNIILDEDTLLKIVKEDKIHDFLKIMRKKNKKTIIFCHNPLWQHINAEDVSLIIMDQQKISAQLGIFSKFDGIKSLVAQTHSPFKNPKQAFLSMKDPDELI